MMTNNKNSVHNNIPSSNSDLNQNNNLIMEQVTNTEFDFMKKELAEFQSALELFDKGSKTTLLADRTCANNDGGFKTEEITIKPRSRQLKTKNTSKISASSDLSSSHLFRRISSSDTPTTTMKPFIQTDM